MKLIPFPNTVKVNFVNPSFIYYCKSDGNYSWIILDQEKIHCNYRLKEVEEKLSSFDFLRLHKQYIINPNRVKEYHKKDGGYVIMADGEKIPISRNRKEEVLKQLNIF